VIIANILIENKSEQSSADFRNTISAALLKYICGKMLREIIALFSNPLDGPLSVRSHTKFTQIL